DDDSIKLSPRSHGHAEELLAHQEHVAVHHLGLGLETQERSVGAAEIGDVDLPALRGEATVQAGDVPVLREGDVGGLAAEVDPRLGEGEGVAYHVAADDQRDATDVPLGRAAHPLDAVGGGRGRVERLEADDLLPDAEDVAGVERYRLVAAQLLV